MSILPWIVIGLAVLLIIMMWVFRDRPQCPHCRSHKVGLVSKNPLSMKGYDQPTGREGMGTIVQLRYEVMYRCDNCREKWTETITETR